MSDILSIAIKIVFEHYPTLAYNVNISPVSELLIILKAGNTSAKQSLISFSKIS